MSDDIIARTEALLAGITGGDWIPTTTMGVYALGGSDIVANTYGHMGNTKLIAAAPSLLREYMEEVRALRHAVKLTLEWFGPSFEYEGETSCPVCGEQTEHTPNCPYPALMRWSKG